MQSPDTTSLGVRSLFVSWLTLSRRMIHAITDSVGQWLEGGADTVKDTIMDLDLGSRSDAGDLIDLEKAPPLPPLDSEQLVAHMRCKVELVLRQAAAAINEDARSCWEAQTHERVQTLFSELGNAALAEALELRVTAAESRVPPQQSAPGLWAHRYRLLRASEGRWPMEGQREP